MPRGERKRGNLFKRWLFIDRSIRGQHGLCPVLAGLNEPLMTELAPFITAPSIFEFKKEQLPYLDRFNMRAFSPRWPVIFFGNSFLT